MYSHSRWVADLSGFAIEVARGPGALLGHSYGGFLALELAVMHPAALSHLILMGTSAGPVPTEVPELRSDEAVREFFRARWPLFFPGPDKHWDVFDSLTFSWQPFAQAFGRELPAYDLRCLVSTLNIPTLLVVGSEDHYRPNMEWLAGRLPQARLEVIPGSGHMPFLDAPEAFAAVVAHFLDHESDRIC
jgi:3-oxoadipate enol-lactonase